MPGSLPDLSIGQILRLRGRVRDDAGARDVLPFINTSWNIAASANPACKSARFRSARGSPLPSRSHGNRRRPDDDRLRRGRQFLRQRRGLRRRAGGGRHGRNPQGNGWPRDEFVVSSKVFWGGDKPNQKGLSRKHVVEACHAALRRLQVDYLDLYFCHRPDPDTPIEETVRAMTDLIHQGKVLYWGTSEWSADRSPKRTTRAQVRPGAADDGAAAVQHVHARQSGAGIRAALRRHRVGHDDLVAAGQRDADRQVPRRRPGRHAHLAQELRMAARDISPTRRPRSGWTVVRARRSRQGTGHQPAAVGAGVVPEESARQHGDHGRVARRTAARTTWRRWKWWAG